VLLAVLVLLAFHRPAWGVSIYMLTFFAFPDFWWWGRPIAGYRWSFYSGCVLLAAVVLSRLSGGSEARQTRLTRRVAWLAVLILINATVVQVFLAPYPEISVEAYTLLAKFVLLFFLIVAAARTREDLRIILLSVVLGAGYIGYECTINDRGRLRGNRLEGVGCPSAHGANELASVMVTVLPITGAFFLAGRRREKWLMVPIAPFIVNVVLLCNSRGAFLSALAAGGALLFFTPRLVRKRILQLLVLGAVATWLLLGDPRIVDRFFTSFADKEELDHSASERMVYWRAGLQMISDHPLGAGGDGFKKVYASRYLAQMGRFFQHRAVHNGFINEACEWGIQGLLLRMLFVGGALALLWRIVRSSSAEHDLFGRLLGCCLFAGIIAFLGTCLFGDRLDNEWGYWMVAMAVAYGRLYGVAVPSGLAPAGSAPPRLPVASPARPALGH
jgi:hypothetical protein